MKATVLLLIVINAASLHEGSLVGRPSDVVAQTGQSIEFLCQTDNPRGRPVDWRYQPVTSRIVAPAVVGGSIIEDLDERWSFKMEAGGVNRLLVSNISTAESGRFTCIDNAGLGETASAELVVLEGAPECSSDTTEIHFLNANYCGQRHDIVNITCSVRYHGNIPPSLDWVDLDEESIFVNNLDLPNYRMTASLLLPATSVRDGHAYECQALHGQYEVHGPLEFEVIAPTPQPTTYCFSPIVTIATNQVLPVEEFTCQLSSAQCFQCGNPNCDYYWIDRQTNATLAAGLHFASHIKPAAPYSFQCLTSCTNNGSRFQIASNIFTCLESENRSVTCITIIIIESICLTMAVICFLTSYKFKNLRQWNLIGTDDNDCEAEEFRCRACNTVPLLSVGVEANIIYHLPPIQKAIDPLQHPEVLSLPLEVTEQLLLEATVIYCKQSWTTTSKPNAFQALASVCPDWHRAMTTRKWFKTRIRQQLNKFVKPYSLCPRRLSTLDTNGCPVRGIVQWMDEIYIICVGKGKEIMVFSALPPYSKKKKVPTAPLR